MEQENKKRSPLFSLKYLVYDFVKITAGLPGLLWFRPRIRYENEAAKKRIRGGAVIFANHVGFFDPIFVMFAVWYRRHRFICSKEFFESKARWWFKRFGCIPVDRQNFNLGSLRTISEALTEGCLVSIFPEGYINDSGALAAFKSGMVLMALQGKAPIVPVYLRPGKHFYNRLHIMIGEPIDIISRCGGRPSMPQIEEITADLHRKEEELKLLTG